MKILVFAHRLEVGGTQINAIEIAGALRDGFECEVVVFASPGPMVELVQRKALRYFPAPDVRHHPSPARMRALREVVRREKPDVIHAWDWWQCLDAYYSVHLPMRIPMIVTDMMPVVTRIIPKRLITTYWTPELVQRAKALGHRKAELLQPPVDLAENAPGVVDGDAFRAQYGIARDDIALVTVSRLASSLKGESLQRTLAAMRVLGRDSRLRLILVGDGELRNEIEREAAAINAELGRAAVLVTGMLTDPRPAYAAADVVIGMGGSALRGMAFGKPVVMVGEHGFSKPFSPETSDEFLFRGPYGVGDGDVDNAALIGNIESMAGSPECRSALGQYGRRFVLEHYSLDGAARQVAALCRQAAAEGVRRRSELLDSLRTTAIYLRERRFLTPSRD